MAARKLPSLNALRAFEASARHQSFTLAAQELNVTQGAVSHQVKALEEELGLPLFERLSNQLHLTETGRRYLDVVGDAFDRIEKGTRSLHAPADRHCLSISTSPNFAAKWLVPRLGDFTAQYPELALRLEQSERHVNFLREDIDLAIRYGAGPWPGLSCVRLGDEFLLPVCAPSFSSLRSAEDIAGMTALHVHDRQAWSDWFAAQDWQAPPGAGIVFNHESAAIDAAIAGQGVALARSSLAAQALRQGTLIAPLPLTPQLTAPLAQAYWLVYPQEGEIDGKVAAFSNWLLQSFEADRQFWKGLSGSRDPIVVQ
ncbi:transcriptional regulator GcvA [Herbaspirillum sp. RV1423]|uniref:transcriptional regulator GcvA n=1 Tax=Herbaspirillum sp. RV1423 TaxID=1443993 RepID=UPI0004BC2B19|nr:transcriptional regulator GcvA [Herbaspirillum sp. RV1423]